MKYLLLLALVGGVLAEELSSASNSTRSARLLVNDIVNNLDVDTVRSLGSKAMSLARVLPAALSTWTIGPVTGALVGVIAMVIFIITIIVVIAEIGVIPVGGVGRSDQTAAESQFQPQYLNQRFSRALNDLTSKVHSALDKFDNQEKQD